MAVFQRIKELFDPEGFEFDVIESVEPAPATSYEVKPLTDKHLEEVLLLNLRCFRRGENYTKQTFEYLLTSPSILGYRVITEAGQMVGFIFIAANTETLGHITTIGIAPEHRKRGLGRKLLDHAENSLKQKDFEAMVLEVRVSNFAAQNLYANYGYVIIQKLKSYYQNGEDAYLMSKAL